jgi:hypothetical protein
MMQTMNLQESHPLSLPIRLLLLSLSLSSMAGALLNLLGHSPFGFLYLVPLAMVFLVLRMLGLRERAQAKKKAPGRSARPGA